MSKPQNIEAITATIDFEILVNKKNEVITESISVIKKFLRSSLFTKEGKCTNDITKLSQVKKPNNNPSYMLLLNLK